MPFPNPATQFKRGHPGGPGRPKKRKLDEILDKLAVERDGEGATWDEKIVRAWLTLATDGDMVAIKEYLLRRFGPPLTVPPDDPPDDQAFDSDGQPIDP